MDMNVDPKRIRGEREKRAWSQEHLAEVAGVALRTVQRVEATGGASFETAKALAAVFGIDVAVLREVVTESVVSAPPAAQARPARPSRVPYYALAASMLVVISLLVARTAVAGQVMLDVLLAVDGKQVAKNQLTTQEGKDAQIRLEGQMRVVVTPKVRKDGAILLAIRLDEYAGGRWALVGTPAVLALDNIPAEVKLTSEKGTVFAIAITPHKI